MRAKDLMLPTGKSTLAGSLQLYVSRPKKVNEILKPTSGFMYSVTWTSTAIKEKNGYTSEWVEWCKQEMPQWLSDTGTIYKVNAGARILNMNTDKDAIKIAKFYGVNPPKDQYSAFMFLARNFPWDEIENDFDGIHHVPTGSRMNDMMMSSWDVESTAWFNKRHLENLGEVKVSL